MSVCILKMQGVFLEEIIEGILFIIYCSHSIWIIYCENKLASNSDYFYCTFVFIRYKFNWIMALNADIKTHFQIKFTMNIQIVCVHLT